MEGKHYIRQATMKFIINVLTYLVRKIKSMAQMQKNTDLSACLSL